MACVVIRTMPKSNFSLGKNLAQFRKICMCCCFSVLVAVVCSIRFSVVFFFFFFFFNDLLDGLFGCLENGEN